LGRASIPPSQDDVHDMSSLEEPISLSDSECNNASFKVELTASGV